MKKGGMKEAKKGINIYTGKRQKTAVVQRGRERKNVRERNEGKWS
jgi:hypothetical protein